MSSQKQTLKVRCNHSSTAQSETNSKIKEQSKTADLEAVIDGCVNDHPALRTAQGGQRDS